MSIRSANLVLDEPQAAYYSGQVLKGHLELVLDEPLEYAAINVTYVGAAQVEWTEYEGSNGRDGLVHYKGREVYFDVVQCLSGGQGLNRLDLGVHNFPFQFQIPPHCPSSFIASAAFKGSAGVAYSIKANVVYGPGKPPGKEESQVEKDFQVIAPFDLNKGNEDICKPITLELEETISCCFSYNPICVTVSLPHAGYCPGQDIPITVACTNESSYEIKRMLFQLVQKERYRSTRPVSDMIVPERVLTEVKSGPVLSKMKQEVIRYLRVPDMIAPNLMNCSIIDVGFFLKVKLNLSGCNDAMEDTAELCLGLIPLTSSQNSDKYIHPYQSRLPNAPIPEITSVPMIRETVQIDMPVQSKPYSPSGYPQPMSTPGPYPQANAGYPGSSPYPGSNLPIPGSNAPYPGSNTSIHGSNSPIHGPNAPYPGSNTPIPGSNAPYPSSNTPIHGSNAPYPGSNTPIHGPNVPYPGSNTPIPGSNAPYPSSPSPYAVSNIPYARSHSPNPVSNSPYPGANPPYPGPTPGHIGFMMPHPNVPYDAGNRAHSPIPPYPKESAAPSAPSE